MNTSLPCLLGLALSLTLAAQNPRYATFASGCSGSMPTARLILVAPPTTGGTLRVDFTNLPANVAFLLTGLSNTTSLLGPLPFGLAPLGMPGCVAHVSTEVPVLLFGAGNRATFAMAIPPGSGLVGGRFFQQALVLDPGAGNTAAAVVSDAADAVIGLPGWPVGGTPVANMAPIAAGSFTMGSMQGNPDERPVHTVTITRPFWMGKYEVTQAEYQAVMASNPSNFIGSSLPVEQVSWDEAMAYCAAMTASEAAAGRLPVGYQYRLPTEAEWEYCCRAGTTTEWNVGTLNGCGQANFTLDRGLPTMLICVGQTSAVGSYAANAFGLHDMHGNVWEWCLDWWDIGSGYPSGPVSDPYVTSGSNRVFRGGSWINGDYGCRSAIRNGLMPGWRLSTNGFRIVLAPVLVP